MIADLLFENLVNLEDIPADLCTPIDNLIKICVELPAYDQTKLEGKSNQLSLLFIAVNFFSMIHFRCAIHDPFLTS